MQVLSSGLWGRLSLRWLPLAALVCALHAPAHAATSFVIDAALPIDASGYGAGSTFSIGEGASLFDLVVTATSASALDELVLYAQTSPATFSWVDLSHLVSRSAFTPVGGGHGLNQSYTGLTAGLYAFDVFATAGSSVRVVGQSAVTPVPEADALVLAGAGALVAVAAMRKRRSS